MEINNEKLAKIIDITNEFVIEYYTHKHTIEPYWHKIERKITSEDKSINGFDFELGVNIMHELGYINFTSFNDGVKNEAVRTLQLTNKGLLLYFNGGFLKEINSKKMEEMERKKREELMETLQVAMVKNQTKMNHFQWWIAGAAAVTALYYVIQIIEYLSPSVYWEY